MEEERQSAQEQVRRLYEEGEQRTAAAVEDLVGRQAFGEMLARVTENVMALTRIGNDALDLAVRNSRLAGRQDVVRLARQLARTEDKLEMVLQQVERLEERLEAEPGPADPPGSGSRTSGGRGARSSGRNSGATSRRADSGSGRSNSGSPSSGSRRSGQRSKSGRSGSGSGSRRAGSS